MRIVIGVDGSYESMHAVNVAASRQWSDDVRVRVINALSRRSDRADTTAAQALVDRAAGVLRGQGLRVETFIREGDPRDVLVREAEKWNADLVMLGARGMSRIQRLLLGGVASHVAANAPCSVEIVREKRQAMRRAKVAP